MRHKIYLTLFTLSAIALGAGIFGIADFDHAELMTGSFTEADENTEDQQKVHVEQVYWNFGDGKIVEGPLAKHDFAPGTHNVTIEVKKSNGEIEKYHKQIEIEE